MSSSWRDKLESLKNSAARRPADPSRPPDASTPIIVGLTRPGIATGEAMDARRRRRIDAHLGIDFGTRFTKVVLRAPHVGLSVPLSLGSEARPLFPSRVAVLGDQVYPPDLAPPAGATFVDYLKMRLTLGAGGVFGARHTSRDEIAALNACYLAGVLRLAKASAIGTDLIARDAEVRWLAQVGVPAVTYDSPDLARFEDVCTVAWAWQNEAPAACSRSALTQAYNEVLVSRPARQDSPIQVAPELSAAIFHIASRPDAPEGVYAFVDIGGGTLDGTVFTLQRGPTPTVNILSALVKPLGTIPIAAQLAEGEGFEEAERRLVVGPLTAADRQRLVSMEHRVSSLLHEVIARAVLKLYSLDFVSLARSDLDQRMRTNRYHTVPVMLAGGGARSAWYRSTFERLEMRQRAIEGFKVRTVDKPPGVLDEEYARFVVARGLSHGELQLRIDCRLPTEIAMPEPLPTWQCIDDAPTCKDLV